MAEFIHHGAAVWNALEPRMAWDNILFGYFDDAMKHDDVWPVSARSLEDWPALLRDAFQNPSEWPWPRPLDRLRAHSLDRVAPPSSVPRKCIFVSHRQSDSSKAEDLPRAITAFDERGSPNYDVWLDVWDPALDQLASKSQRIRALLTALIIEMGLINSVAVIVLMTDDSYGSNWIPYEFGRVKTGGPFAREASACTRDLGKSLHDYMTLAPRIDYDGSHYVGLNTWLRSL